MVDGFTRHSAQNHPLCSGVRLNAAGLAGELHGEERDGEGAEQEEGHDARGVSPARRYLVARYDRKGNDVSLACRAGRSCGRCRQRSSPPAPYEHDRFPAHRLFRMSHIDLGTIAAHHAWQTRAERDGEGRVLRKSGHAHGSAAGAPRSGSNLAIVRNWEDLRRRETK